MEIGISTASLYMRENIEDAIVTLRELGAKVTECFLETYTEYTPEFARLLKSRIGDLKVHSVHVHTMHYEPELFSDNVRQHQAALELYKNVLGLGQLLGAKCYTMHGRGRIKRSVNYDNYEAVGKRLNKLSDIAGDYGIFLCLENVEWAYYNRVGFFKAVSEYAPNLKAVLDVKQARLSGDDVYSYIGEMGNKLKTVHLSDIDENGKRCLPGKGITDFKELFSALKENGFDGEMLLEVYSGDYGEVKELSDSLEYLREIKKSIFDK